MVDNAIESIKQLVNNQYKDIFGDGQYIFQLEEILQETNHNLYKYVDLVDMRSWEVSHALQDMYGSVHRTLEWMVTYKGKVSKEDYFSTVLYSAYAGIQNKDKKLFRFADEMGNHLENIFVRDSNDNMLLAVNEAFNNYCNSD